jgi:hypothetical protein
VPELDEVPGGQSRSGGVIHNHGANWEIALCMNEDNRELPVRDHVECFIAKVIPRVNKNAVDSSFAKKPGNHLAAGLHVFNVPQQDHVAVLQGSILDTQHELGKDGVGQIWHDQRHRAGFRELERSRREIGGEVKISGCLKNLASSCLAYPR